MTRVVAALAVLLGAAAVVLGGLDDSPGLQGIGVLLVVTGVVVAVRASRRRRAAPQA
jgi:drug/metabolite transporter (DMT)-like permease